MRGITVYDFITLGLVLVASIFGMIRMFRKKVPMYFQLIICGVWCYAFQLVYYILVNLCNMEMPSLYNLCFLGIGASFLFFTSANYGQFNSFVDERGKKHRPIRLISLLAPILFTVSFVYICMSTDYIAVSTVVILATSAVPIIIGSYFNLKFIIFPDDELGMLKGIRPLNVAELILDVVFYLYIYHSLRGNDQKASVFYYLFGLIIVLMTLLAEWGRKKWKKQS